MNYINQCFINRNSKKRTMVSNLYIDKNLKHLKGFKGTFSCDNIPFWGSNDRKMFIVNLSQENKKGSHFVFIEIEKDKALYLDPLGKNLSNSFIKKSLVINGCKKISQCEDTSPSAFINFSFGRGPFPISLPLCSGSRCPLAYLHTFILKCLHTCIHIIEKTSNSYRNNAIEKLACHCIDQQQIEKQCW